MQREAQTPQEVREYASLDDLLEAEGTPIMEYDDWLIELQKWIDMGDSRDRERLLAYRKVTDNPKQPPPLGACVRGAPAAGPGQ